MEEKKKKITHELNVAQEKILSLGVKLTATRLEVDTLRLSMADPKQIIENTSTTDTMIDDMKKQLREVKQESEGTKILLDKEMSVEGDIEIRTLQHQRFDTEGFR
ncbi:hypothetical protein AKJ16_DCAP26476 [Drosera capensis]